MLAYLMKVENGSFNAYNHISFPTRSQRPNGMIVVRGKEKEKDNIFGIWKKEKKLPGVYSGMERRRRRGRNDR